MGQHPRVVCLHGLGRTPTDWDAVRGALGEFGQVIAPVIPPRSADALDLLDEVITPGSVVIGHSMGAVMAMRLVTRRPRPLRAAVLTGCFFPPARNGRSSTEAILDYGAHRVAFLANSRTQRDQRAGRTAFRPLASLLRQALRPDTLEESGLDRVAGAALIVHARDDHHVPVDFAVAAARRHPNWETRLLNDGGHHAHVSHPTIWTDTVCPWLAHKGPASPPAPKTAWGRQADWPRPKSISPGSWAR
jgi:pimeloyl-ACP methyl ester carboxylesterase